MRNTMQLLSESLRIFKENYRLFLALILWPAIFSVLVIIFEPSRETGVINSTEWMIYGLISVISAIVNILLGAAMTYAIADRTLTSKAAYKKAMSVLWRYIGLSLLMAVILIPAFFFFIIPGVILTVWFAFANFVLLLENTGIIEALKKSRSYVKGKWWEVFGRIVALLLIAVVTLMILVSVVSIFGDKMVEDVVGTIISLVLAPIGITYMYLLYRDISGGVVVPATPTPAAMVPPTTPAV